jgi:mannuronan synthase
MRNGQQSVSQRIGSALKVAVPPPMRRVAWVAFDILLLTVFLLIFIAAMPQRVWHMQFDWHATAVLGGLAAWRMGWWFTHLVRAMIYGAWTYPRLAHAAQTAWHDGWRPDHVHVLITAFRERDETIEAVVGALCRELDACGRPATIWLGTREASDEERFAEAIRRCTGQSSSGHKSSGAIKIDIDVRIIRQQQPGKRVAIGLLLRAMARQGLGANDFVAFMDSDFVLDGGALTRSLALFATDTTLHAVTTDENVQVHGPKWVGSWLAMRFAQRRIAMQSHALSGRVLTLTGRFSLFRATDIVSSSFIRLIEADTLDNWLWGRYRFLSGDDKSTWYALLANGHRMLYVPDAHGTTIEHIEGHGVTRMIENLRRWSGNMLRNGSRAIRLGPRRMPLFIWWCLVDQRIAMWTMLFGPLCALLLSMRFGWAVLWGYFAYVLVTRFIAALILSAYSPRFDLNYVWCLYANQLLNAAVKVYMIWRLPAQRWANRGNQVAGAGGQRLLAKVRAVIAAYLTVVSVAGLLLAATLATGVLQTPPLWLLAHLSGN